MRVFHVHYKLAYLRFCLRGHAPDTGCQALFKVRIELMYVWQPGCNLNMNERKIVGSRQKQLPWPRPSIKSHCIEEIHGQKFTDEIRSNQMLCAARCRGEHVGGPNHSSVRFERTRSRESQPLGMAETKVLFRKRRRVWSQSY